MVTVQKIKNKFLINLYFTFKFFVASFCVWCDFLLFLLYVITLS